MVDTHCARSPPYVGQSMPQSLHCPRCNGAVSVADDAAGQRVKCPHCDQTFLAPGFAKATNDDDDWLSLDEAPTPEKTAPPKKAAPQPTTPAQPAKSAAPTNQPAAKPKGRGAPALSADDQALLADFTSDLDDFTAEIEKPPAPFPVSPADQTLAKPTPVAGLSSPSASRSSAAKQPKSPPAANANPVEYATEYRVNCNICGSMLYAKANQAGKTVKCSDCHSPVTIPPPPRVKKKVKINLDEAETFALGQNENVTRKADPYQASAQQLLDEASREEETNATPTYDDTPSVKEWVMNVFGIFKDLGVLVHWVGLSVLASLPAVIALSLDSTILILGLFPAGFFLGVLVVSCGFAILHSVANQEESVSEWPTLDPMAWFGQLFVAVAAAAVAAVPAWALCQFVFGSSMISVAITMLSVYVMFPFILLSMLDMNNVFIPFSAEVARSITKCEEAWGGFYFSSGLLFVGLFLTFVVVAGMSPPAAAVISIVLGIGAAFAYFSMIGRLAYAIGQAVNAPPRKDEVDRSRRTDAV
jgi:DNA-directed RNA polymerase subunit M/transcription elongation factor TFIIS